MTLVELKPRPLAISGEVVAMLKEYLEMAEKGEIIGLAMAGILPDGSCITSAPSSDHFQRIIGAVAILQHRMLEEMRTAG